MTASDQLTPGVPFPDFALPDASGQVRRLHDFVGPGHQGQYLALYVYPKDDTPGCTREACDFRDNLELRAAGVQVLGLSRDDAHSHADFAEKYSLPFPLLSDTGGGYLEALGAFSGGRVGRSTFLVGPDGRLVRAWYGVKVDGHADSVLEAAREDQGQSGAPSGA